MLRVAASQRRKGAAGERELAKLFADELGVQTCRNLEQSRDGGCDLDMPGFAIECKRHKSISVAKWLRQAQKGAKVGDFVMVWMREDGGKWFAAIPGDVALKLMREEL